MTQMLATWMICTSPVLAMIFLVASGRAETFDFTKCDIRDNFQSELVAASFKSLEPGLGCETNATSMAGQEMHVILVDLPESDDENRATVKLSIHSRRHANLEEVPGASFLEEPGPVVFVLHSSQPVTWVVEMFLLNGQQKHLFMVSQDSSVRFQRKKSRRLAKVRKRVLPFSSDSGSIFSWAEKRFGAVTSFSRISELNLKFYIGRDVNANSTCDLNALSSSLRFFSYREADKQITGCISKRRNLHVRAKPVYVIELLESPEPSPGVVGVDLEIIPYDNGASMRSQGPTVDKDDNDWHFYLVVKSPPNLQWTLHSKKISGWVDIVADASADIKVAGVKISTVALRADVIPVTGKQLLEWSQDYIAPVQMYAGIHAANSIILKVPPIDKTMTSIPTGWDHNGQESKRPRDGDWDDDHEYGEPGLGEVPEGLIQVSCTGQVMEVAIVKQFFQVTGVDKTKVTLLDPTCGYTAETDDNIILCTELMHCGTTSHQRRGTILFQNAVVIHTSPVQPSNPSSNEPGSGLFEGDPSSGTQQDPSLSVDDEDFQSSLPLSFPVECALASTIQLSNSSDHTKGVNSQRCQRAEPQPSATCRFKLYKSATLAQHAVDFPAKIARNSVVYIEATVDEDMTILVDTCWLSTSIRPDDLSALGKVVVQQGCATDESLSWSEDNHLATPGGVNLRKTKFSMTVTDVFGGHQNLYLHCDFSTCQRGDGSHSDKCSGAGHVHCDPLDPQHVDIGPRGPGCGPLTVGPLILVDKDRLTKPTPGTDIADTTTSSSEDVQVQGQDQRVIVIEGLDSAAVVGIAFAAFAIGILLIGTLWFIHSHTGPAKRTASSPREAEACSVPTSNLPPPTAV